MIIIPEALPLAKLQRTAMNQKQMINSYGADFDNVIDNATCGKDFKILDIGCGIAGWQCFLEKGEKIYLIDKTKVDEKVYYGYQKKTAFYNSMKIAKKNLIANGIKAEKIFMQEANNKIQFGVKFDLIVSFISCGFHYPVKTYLNQIYEKLEEGGTLMIDIRKGTDGASKIKNLFGNISVIKQENKYLRVKAVKQEKRVGMGDDTKDPSEKLEIYSSGNVGLNSVNPSEKLNIIQ